MSECDNCGLEDSQCHCYLYELEDRVAFLEEEIDKITNVLVKMTAVIMRDEDEW